MERLRMSIVKHWKDSNLQHSPKKRSPFWIKIKVMVPAMLLASLLGTYLDLYFVGVGSYSFPKRILSDVFSINVLFTLIALPHFISIFLYVCDKITRWQTTTVLILLLSLLMAAFEKFAESLGFFVHHESWKHIYSFIGYILYLVFIYSFYHWTKGTRL